MFIEADDEQIEPMQVDSSIPGQTNVYKNDDDIFYEEAMQKKFIEKVRSSNALPCLSNFMIELEAYEKNYSKNRIDSKSSILDFWEQKSVTFPNLYDIAMIVLAAAGTQVSVERLFSHLKFIWGDQRANLSPENLQNILLVRNNFHHLDDKFFRDFILH